jgi:hypothetical protein
VSQAEGLTYDRVAALELAFYRYANDPDVTHQEAALGKLRELLADGVRSPGWRLDGNVKEARRIGHKDAGLVEKLARVIDDEADISELNVFPRWHVEATSA